MFLEPHWFGIPEKVKGVTTRCFHRGITARHTSFLIPSTSRPLGLKPLSQPVP